MANDADVVVCGAGLAGLALAYHLAVRHRVRRVTVVDEREPLTLTSDKGTQAYRNWWPGPDDTMLRYMTRSIDLLEEMADESGNAFRLNRRGYVFITALEAQARRRRGRRMAHDESTHRLLEPFPGGVHVRPIDGPCGDEVYLIWTFDVEPRPFIWPPRFDPHYAEIAIRAAARMLPGMRAYFGTGPAAVVDGGYYCKTRENRPLVGPLPVDGAYVLGALSGYGIMGSHAGADLLAAHLTGAALPEYADRFLPSRYDEPGYRETIERWGANVGQL